MIQHPVILGSKLIVLIIIIVALLILRGILTPEQFRVAVVVGAAVFVCFSVVIWAVFLKLLSNPESKVSRQMVLSHQARTEDGFQAVPLGGDCLEKAFGPVLADRYHFRRLFKITKIDFIVFKLLVHQLEYR